MKIMKIKLGCHCFELTNSKHKCLHVIDITINYTVYNYTRFDEMKKIFIIIFLSLVFTRVGTKINYRKSII